MASKHKPTPYRIARAILDFDVFGYRVTFVFTNDLQRARDEYDEVIGRHFDATGAGAFHTAVDEAMDNRSFIFFKENAQAEQIAHEASHVIFRMLKWAGVVENDSEVFAYHLGHLVGNISRAQEKLIPVRRRKNHVKHSGLHRNIKSSKRAALREVRAIAPATAAVDDAGKD